MFNVERETGMLKIPVYEKRGEKHPVAWSTYSQFSACEPGRELRDGLQNLGIV
jgi:hypothetical protein